MNLVETNKTNYSLDPTYSDLIVDAIKAVKWYYREDNWFGCNTFPYGFVDEFKHLFHFPLHEVYYIVYIAVFFTLIRYLFEYQVCKVKIL